MMERSTSGQQRTLLNQVHDAVITTDLDGIITTWNVDAEGLFGYGAAEAPGQNMSILCFPEDRPALKSKVSDPLEGRVKERTRELKAANDRLQVEIAERVRVESELRSERARLQHLVVNTPGVLYSCSNVYPFGPVFISANVERLFSYSADELTQEPDLWLSRIHPDDAAAVAAGTAKLIDSGMAVQEYRFRVRDGSHRWVRDSSVVVRNLTGETPEIIGYCENITETKRASEALRKQEMHAAMEQALLTTQESERKRISRELHDNLNQDLASLMLDIALLDRTPPKSISSLRQNLKTLHHRIAEISDNVHQIAAELHPARLEQVGLGPALEAHCSALSRRVGIEIIFTCRSLPAQLHPEAALCIYRVAQESLANVVRHSKSPRAEVTLEETRGGVCLSVTDFGIGFDTAAVPPGRLGLLSMAERARLAGGTFSLDSTAGQGTRVQLWIAGAGS